jgi:hypothetical protein
MKKIFENDVSKRQINTRRTSSIIVVIDISKSE